MCRACIILLKDSSRNALMERKDFGLHSFIDFPVDSDSSRFEADKIIYGKQSNSRLLLYDIQ